MAINNLGCVKKSVEKEEIGCRKKDKGEGRT